MITKNSYKNYKIFDLARRLTCEKKRNETMTQIEINRANELIKLMSELKDCINA